MPSIVQEFGNEDPNLAASGTTLSATGAASSTPGAALKAGSCVVAYATWDSGGVPTAAFSDSINGAWTLVDNVNDATNQQAGAVWIKFNVAAGDPTYTLTLGTARTSRGYHIVEIQGVWGAVFGHAAQLQAAPGTGADGLTSTAITPARPGALLLGYCVHTAGPTTPAAGTGFTGPATFFSFGGAFSPLGRAESKSLSTTTAAAATFTAGTNNQHLTFGIVLVGPQQDEQTYVPPPRRRRPPLTPDPEWSLTALAVATLTAASWLGADATVPRRPAPPRGDTDLGLPIFTGPTPPAGSGWMNEPAPARRPPARSGSEDFVPSMLPAPASWRTEDARTPPRARPPRGETDHVPVALPAGLTSMGWLGTAPERPAGPNRVPGSDGGAGGGQATTSLLTAGWEQQDPRPRRFRAPMFDEPFGLARLPSIQVEGMWAQDPGPRARFRLAPCLLPDNPTPVGAPLVLLVQPPVAQQDPTPRTPRPRPGDEAFASPLNFLPQAPTSPEDSRVPSRARPALFTDQAFPFTAAQVLFAQAPVSQNDARTPPRARAPLAPDNATPTGAPMVLLPQPPVSQDDARIPRMQRHANLGEVVSGIGATFGPIQLAAWFDAPDGVRGRRIPPGVGATDGPHGSRIVPALGAWFEAIEPAPRARRSPQGDGGAPPPPALAAVLLPWFDAPADPALRARRPPAAFDAGIFPQISPWTPWDDARIPRRPRAPGDQQAWTFPQIASPLPPFFQANASMEERPHRGCWHPTMDPGDWWLAPLGALAPHFQGVEQERARRPAARGAVDHGAAPPGDLLPPPTLAGVFQGAEPERPRARPVDRPGGDPWDWLAAAVAAGGAVNEDFQVVMAALAGAAEGSVFSSTLDLVLPVLAEIGAGAAAAGELVLTGAAKAIPTAGIGRVRAVAVAVENGSVALLVRGRDGLERTVRGRRVLLLATAEADAILSVRVVGSGTVLWLVVGDA